MGNEFLGFLISNLPVPPKQYLIVYSYYVIESFLHLYRDDKHVFEYLFHKK